MKSLNLPLNPSKGTFYCFPVAPLETQEDIFKSRQAIFQCLGADPRKMCLGVCPNLIKLFMILTNSHNCICHVHPIACFLFSFWYTVRSFNQSLLGNSSSSLPIFSQALTRIQMTSSLMPICFLINIWVFTNLSKSLPLIIWFGDDVNLIQQVPHHHQKPAVHKSHFHCTCAMHRIAKYHLWLLLSWNKIHVFPIAAYMTMPTEG